MIGYYGYTMVLTYISVASAVFGMWLALSGNIKHAFICLIVSGVCDMLDGPVARSSKKRTNREKGYGVQLDSLADLVSFGVFPVIIGYSLGLDRPIHAVVFSVYVLAALIRLAYFNVTEMELQNDNIKRTYYMGLPVTNSACIIPTVYAVSLFLNTSSDRTHIIYAVMLIVLSVMYLLKIKIPKVRTRYIAAFSFVLAGPVLYLILRS